jgi:hypothetical protein
MWQMSSTGNIYRAAMLTLVAAAGSDVNAGFPGLHNQPITIEKGRTPNTKNLPMQMKFLTEQWQVANGTLKAGRS